MNVTVPIGLRPVEFALELAFQPEPLDFIYRVEAGALRNQEQIERQLRAINQCNHVKLIGRSPGEIGRVAFGLDADIYFYHDSESIWWAIKDVKWLPLQSLGTLQAYLDAARPLLVSAAQAEMQKLKAQMKQDICDEIRQIATRMIENGAAIQRFLDAYSGGQLK